VLFCGNQQVSLLFFAIFFIVMMNGMVMLNG